MPKKYVRNTQDSEHWKDD